MHAHVGRALVDGGPHVDVRAEPVADGVLHAQRRELEALQRRTRGGDIDAQRPGGQEELLPVDGVDQRIQVRFVPVPATGDTPQDAARDARFQVGAIREREVALERHASLGGRDTGATQSRELGGEDTFQTARTWREVAFGHGVIQNGLATTRYTMPANAGAAGISLIQR